MKLLKRLANSPAGRRLAGWTFAHMSWSIPVKRLRETETLLAFYHPQPAYPFHVVLAPRKEIQSFAALEPGDPFMADLVRVTQALVEEYQLGSWRLVLNGGGNQEFPHLHFHLIAEAKPARGASASHL